MRTRVTRRALQTITIQVDGAERQLEAEVIGQWAVHPAWGGGQGAYAVTYVRAGDKQSGLGLGRLMDTRVDRATAIRLAEVLDSKLGAVAFDRAEHEKIVLAEVNRMCGKGAA